MIVTGYEVDDIWGYCAKLFIVNKTDKTVMVTVDDASVNGFMIDPFYATSIIPGKCVFDSVSWSNSGLEENEIDVVEEIEFKLRVYDYNNFLADDFVNQIVTLNP